MKRSAGFVLLMIFGIGLMIWAGVYSLRERKLALQKAQENRVVLVPDNASAGGSTGGSNDKNAKTVDAASEDQPEPMKGKAAPAFTLVTLDGRKVSLSDYKGRPVLVNFWATWCAPCKLEMPWFEEFHTKYKEQGFEILGIAEDDAGKDEIEKAVKRINVSYPILLTDGKVAPAYGGVDFLPMSFYVDRNGVVEKETSGLASKDEVEANIKSIVQSRSGSAATTAGVAFPTGASQ